MKKKIIVFILLPIALISFAFTGCGEKQHTATDIYNQCLYNVVEVKAVSENVGESFGTAEIIDRDGTLVTNAHVVTYTRLNVVHTFESYYIRFSCEDDYREVTLEKFDSEKDIALLKLKDAEDLNIKPVNIGNSDNLKAGQRVYAVGNASNYGIGIFEGIVSIPLINIELDRIMRSVIQCDLTIAAGNSGGALLNAAGELVGLTTFRTKDNSGNVIYGIVYCIPINIVLEFVNAK